MSHISNENTNKLIWRPLDAARIAARQIPSVVRNFKLGTPDVPECES